MVTTSVNYSGRTTDVLIFQGIDTGKEVQVALGLGTSGSVTTGIEKVAQTFAVLFLTDVGSVTYDTSRGTSFMPYLRRGLIRTDEDVKANFQFAAGDIIAYLASRYDDSTPDDERLATATLLAWDLTSDSLRIDVKLTSAAGTSFTFYIPVSTAIR